MVMRDYTDDLAAVENSLRRIIERIGQDSFGIDYLLRFGISESKLEKWKTKKEQEEDRRGAGIQESRLLYFSNLYDLQTIILDNWDKFEPVFGKRQKIEVYLNKIRELRNPEAHHRELAESEKLLITGMVGEIRTQITRYLSNVDTPDEYFPRMESLRDNLGNSMNPPKRPVIRVGDQLEFIAEAWDPFGSQIEYQWNVSPSNQTTFQDWSHNNRFKWIIQSNQVGNPTWLNVNMRSSREFHAEGDKDASWSIGYTVLPEDSPKD